MSSDPPPTPSRGHVCLAYDRGGPGAHGCRRDVTVVLRATDPAAGRPGRLLDLTRVRVGAR